jgi:RecA/RadA recombinase
LRPDTEERVEQGAATDDALGSGGVIGVCGPDGVGKTTLCDALVSDVLAGREVLHVRFPGLLPRRDPVKRRELRLGAGVTLPEDPEAFPERAYPPQYSAAKSLAKTLYLFVDFWLGWVVNVAPLTRRGGWVVFERGWWDHAVDARRYRLRSPRLVRGLGQLLPRWDLVLVLDAPADLIRARKPELPTEEIRRQSRSWREVFPARQRRAYLDASRPAAEVLERARAEITEVARAKPPAARRAAGEGTPGRARPLRLGRHGSAAADRWVLVTDGARNRSALAAVRSLAAGGYRPAVASAGASLAGASRHCARRVAVPPPSDEGYPDALRAELERGYLTALPASDRAMLALGAPGSQLLDKEVLGRRAAEAGLQTPPSRLFSSPAELLEAAPKLDYPIVVKPTVERYVPRRFDSPAELNGGLAREGALLVQPFLDAPLTAVSGVIWRGRLVAAVHQRYLRIWPFEVGTVCAAETTAPDDELEGRLVRLLAGYDGIFQAQLIGPYLLDVHPRVHGSMPLCDAAGANLAAIFCDLLRGEEVGPVAYRRGARYRWLESDLAHLYRAWRTGRMGTGAALAALRPRRGTAHSTESLTDPAPLAARLRLRG